MADKAEKMNIETGAWWAEWAKKEYKNTLSGKEFGKAETEADRKKAAELLKQIQWAEWMEAKREVIKKNYSTLPPEIKTAINQLNRPEARKWLEESYMNIDTTIQNSTKDQNRFARLMGKIIKWINP